MGRSHDHVVVLGASMAGLLAARVLAERYEQVTIVERDALPPTGQHRQGVPHGRHVHGLHPRGREVLEELFPGFTAEVTAAGAVLCDVLADARWQLSGHLLRQRHAGLPALLASRPFLEGHVRERVLGHARVSVLERCSVAGLVVAPGGRDVAGARVPELWMAIEDVFHIRSRGTVVTGQLQGVGQLSVGDALLCGDGQRWEVSGIEQFRKKLITAEPGSNIGVLLRAGPAPDTLRGRRVWFEPAAAAVMNAPFTDAARRKKRWRG